MDSRLRYNRRSDGGRSMGKAQLTDNVLGQAIAKAFDLVSEALARLDEAGAPADIGAHLDLALHRMGRLNNSG